MSARPDPLLNGILFSHALAPGERNIGYQIYSNLNTLENHVRNFAACVALFDSTRKGVFKGIDRAVVQRWAIMAAAHGAIIIQDTCELIGITLGLLKNAPHTASYIDTKARNLATSTLNDAFPGIACIRFDAAHPGRNQSTDEQRRKHAAKDFPLFSPDGPGVYMTGCLVNDRYTCTVHSKVVSYAPDQNAVEALEQSVTYLRQAFSRPIPDADRYPSPQETA